MKQKNPSDNSSPATVPRLGKVPGARPSPVRFTHTPYSCLRCLAPVCPAVVQAAAALLLWGVVLFGITTAINESPLTGFTLPAWLLVVVDVATKQVAIPFVIGVRLLVMAAPSGGRVAAANHALRFAR